MIAARSAPAAVRCQKQARHCSPIGRCHWQQGWLFAEDVRHCPSPNFGVRPPHAEVNLLVMHNISLPAGKFAPRWVERFLCNRLSPQHLPPRLLRAQSDLPVIAEMTVSAHFYVRRSGRIVQLVSCDQRAWHAGKSQFQGRENCNDFSIGIELAGCDWQPYTLAQYRSVNRLITRLRRRYPLTAITGHQDIAPERKTDPGPFLRWSWLPMAHHPAHQSMIESLG